MIQKPIDLYTLYEYQAVDELERSHLSRILAYANSPQSKLLRADSDGHFTASSFILNAEGTHALLLYHDGLLKWLQPGGHVEPEDESFFAAAEREMEEETTLINLKLVSPTIFDVDVHFIPARPSRQEKEHFHYDLRFLFQIPSNEIQTQCQERLAEMGLKWVLLTELIQLADESMARMAHKGIDWIEKNNRSPSENSFLNLRG